MSLVNVDLNVWLVQENSTMHDVKLTPSKDLT